MAYGRDPGDLRRTGNICPRWVLDRVFAIYAGSSQSPGWMEAEQITRNMGLYNWFLALGLGLCLMTQPGNMAMAQFFLGCISVAGIFGMATVSPFWAFYAQLALGAVPLVLIFLKI